MARYLSARLVRCQRCRLVYAGELPSLSELGEHYAQYPPAGELSALTARRYDELLDRLEPFRHSGRLLDVGCGDGLFLVAALARGWNVYGSEYGEAPRERARARGLDVRPAPFPAAPSELGSFDVVTAMEVIEHVATPRAEVEQIKTLLRAGGCVYLTTPNFSALTRRLIGPRWRAIDYPEHLNLFTPKTLDRLLSHAQLKPLWITTTGFSPSDVWSGIKLARDDRDDQRPTLDQRLRAGMSVSQLLDRGARAANAVLSALRVGDTIKAAYQR